MCGTVEISDKPLLACHTDNAAPMGKPLCTLTRRTEPDFLSDRSPSLLTWMVGDGRHGSPSFPSSLPKEKKI